MMLPKAASLRCTTNAALQDLLKLEDTSWGKTRTTPVCRHHVVEVKEIHNTPVPTLIADGYADHIFVEGVSPEEIAKERGLMQWKRPLTICLRMTVVSGLSSSTTMNLTCEYS